MKRIIILLVVVLFMATVSSAMVVPKKEKGQTTKVGPLSTEIVPVESVAPAFSFVIGGSYDGRAVYEDRGPWSFYFGTVKPLGSKWYLIGRGSLGEGYGGLEKYTGEAILGYGLTQPSSGINLTLLVGPGIDYEKFDPTLDFESLLLATAGLAMSIPVSSNFGFWLDGEYHYLDTGTKWTPLI